METEVCTGHEILTVPAVPEKKFDFRWNAIIFAGFGLSAFVITLLFAAWVVGMIVSEAGGIGKVADLKIGDVWIQLLGLLSIGTLGTVALSSCFSLAATMLQPAPPPCSGCEMGHRALDIVDKMTTEPDYDPSSD